MRTPRQTVSARILSKLLTIVAALAVLMTVALAMGNSAALG